jgi:hypothetical protein
MSFSRNLKRTDHLLRRWAEEPIGVAVPFLAFLAVWLPPQMPDMFAGMEAPLWKLQISTRPFLFALAAMTLGLSAWFWTRAALTAQREHGETDKARISRKKGLSGAMAKRVRAMAATRDAPAMMPPASAPWWGLNQCYTKCQDPNL